LVFAASVAEGAEPGARFSWVAVNHHDTGHAHIRFVLRGHQGSTRRRQSGILMHVHLGSSAGSGVLQLQLRSSASSGEQPPRRQHLAHEVRRGVLKFERGWRAWLKAMELHPDIRKPPMAERRVAQQAERERLARRLSRTELER
jgi:hypothetical protein